jgi:hypothetical protein
MAIFDFRFWTFDLKNSFGAESDDGINARGAARGQPRGNCATQAKNENRANPDQRTARGSIGPLLAHDSCRGPGREGAGKKPERHQARGLTGDKLNQRAGGRAESEPNSKFARPPRHLQRE